MSADLLEVVEAAYRVEQAPVAWLASASTAVERQFARGFISSYFVDCSDGGFRRWAPAWTAGAPPAATALYDEYDRFVPLAMRRAIHTFAPCGSNDDLPEPSEDSDWFTRETARWSVFGVNAIDVTLRGCCFSRWELRATSVRTTEKEIEDWSRLSAHLAAGARLTHALEGLAPLDHAEAIIEPSGKLVHASGQARGKLAREALRSEARAQDRARTRRGRASGADAVAAWQALVKGRWSVLDHFDSDGRRFVVAQPNEPLPATRRALTARERQVATAASLGHSNKLIAYELGLDPSTVAKLLARARAKLGVGTRVELVATLQAPDEPEPSR